MKIKENISTAVVVGDMDSKKISINPEDLNIMTQFLSIKLYSNPIESFLRETVSNAWDSHVEAGVSDPILLEINRDTEKRIYCRIQDFGTGISKERFNDIYLNLGSSTKRDSNELIGAFGLGRLSALAYSDNAYITSNYEGIKYKYLMYKDGLEIKIDKLFESPTTERNGVEVLIYIKEEDVYTFFHAIKNQLAYFENLYLSVGNDIVDEYAKHDFVYKFNNLKIKKYKTFLVNSFQKDPETTICLGKIQYPLNTNVLKHTKFKFSDKYPIAVNFEIGELEVTRNREQLIYNKETIEKLEARLDMVQDEIDSIIEKHLKKDYTDFIEYMEALKTSNFYSVPLLEDKHNKDNDVFIMFTSNINYLSFKGKVYDNNIYPLYYYITNKTMSKDIISFVIKNGKIERNLDYCITLKDIIFSDKSYYIVSHNSLNTITKSYLKSLSVGEIIFIKSISIFSVYKSFLRAFNKMNEYSSYKHVIKNREQIKLIIKEIILILKEKVKSFTNLDVPESFITKRKQELKQQKLNKKSNNINSKKEIVLHVLKNCVQTIYNDGVVSRPVRYNIEDLKFSLRRVPIIYSTIGDKNLRDLFKIFNFIEKQEFRQYKFVEVTESNAQILKQFSNFIKIEDYININQKKIRIIATSKLLNVKYPHIKKLYYTREQLCQISTKLNEVVTRVFEYMNIYSSFKHLEQLDNDILKKIYNLCKEYNYYDEEMLGYVNENRKYIENSKYFLLLADKYDTILDKVINLAVYLVLKEKLFIPDLKAVKKLRKETIYNLK
jgi:hypothetical protein